MAVWDKKQNNHNNQNIKAVACQELDVCGRRLRSESLSGAPLPGPPSGFGGPSL
jgi:hypothetical protein